METVSIKNCFECAAVGSRATGRGRIWDEFGEIPTSPYADGDGLAEGKLTRGGGNCRGECLVQVRRDGT